MGCVVSCRDIGETRRSLFWKGCPSCLDLSPPIVRISPQLLLANVNNSSHAAPSGTSSGNAPAWCCGCTAQPLLSHGEAAAQVGLHPDSVRHWRRRWAQGDFCLHDELGRGRHPRFSPAGPRVGQGRRLRTGGRNQATLEPAVAGRCDRTRTEGVGATDQSQHGLADLRHRRHQALAVQALDLPATRCLLRKPADAGPVCGPLAGQAPGPQGPHPQR